jgi:type IV pilus assembly protein PilY1
MKTTGKYWIKTPLLIFLFMLFLPVLSSAATMNDYCITPPYIVGGIKPNLLLMFDNSASMYDLNYVDKGTASRTPAYCYDQTYRGAVANGAVTNLYEGYFDVNSYYLYDQASGYFTVTNTFPASCSKRVEGTLCIDLDTSTPKKVTNFVARGNYLNWLTASKFDVQKTILTGGKYSGGNLISESRGCVGRGYIKEALTADYSEGGTNTSLGITFSIKGAPEPVNFTAPSRGGQTYIYIYEGDYNAGNCQEAIDLYNTCNTMSCKADLEAATSRCLNITNLTDLATKAKITYKQSVQECVQYKMNGTVGNDAVNSIKGGGNSVSCTTLYNGRAAATPACTDGPKCIKAGDPDLLCSDDYTGACFSGVYNSGTWSDIWTQTVNIDGTDYTGDACIIKKHNQYCAMFDTAPVVDPTDVSSTTATSSNVPAIISDLGVEGQLKAPLKLSAVADDKLTVKNHRSEPPPGLIQDFASRIRMGALAFNYNGSLSECVNLSTDPIPCPKICSGGIARSCGSNIDCDTYTTASGTCNSITVGYCKKGNETTTTPCSVNSDCNALGNGYNCNVSTSLRCSNNTAKSCTGANQSIDCAGQPVNYSCVADTTNKDAAKIYHYVGQGACFHNNTITCAKDEHCGSGNKCNSSGVGTHSSGLVNVIDNLTGATWTPFAEAFYNAIGYFAKGKNADETLSTTNSRNDLRINEGDYLLNMNPSQYRCQSNNVLLISDGVSTADRHTNVSNLAGLYNDGDGNITTTTALSTDCPKFKGSKNVDDLAWLGKHRNINQFSKSTASTTEPTERSDYISSYVVFSGADNGGAGECNSTTMMSQTATNGGTTLLQATNFSQLRGKIKKALDDISAGVSSGTAASILSNSEGSGANILQALFYPKRIFTDNTEADWIGEMQNLWYYVDPFIGNSTVREDTGYTSGDHFLNLTSDYVASFFFVAPETKVRRYRDTDGNGSGDTLIDEVYPDDVKSIWRAGNQLWARESPRDILTTVNGTSLIDFSTGNAVTLQPYLQAAASPSLEAAKIIMYVHGIDLAKLPTANTYYDPNYRNRTVTTKHFITGATDTRVWKLGDIISSTPRLQSSIRQNAYNLDPPTGYGDASYADYTNTTAYKNRGMAYVGANDGMLHAFNLGVLDVTARDDLKATLTGSGLGEEQWAFIPKSVLPYLKYLSDPSYSHLYLVDGTSAIADISICAPGACAGSYWNEAKSGSTWRTVLIGSMGLGGAAKSSTDSCTADLNGDGVVDNKDCVKTPINGVGYSSYFALDVTDPVPRTLLWEYSDPALGYATSGPAVVRASSKKADGSPDHTKNGRWFAVFASGPTGPIDTDKSEFLGRSDQNLKIFIHDMKVPTDVWTIDTGIANAFAGTISGGVLDSDRLNKNSNGFYQDDAVYIGYVRKCVTGDTGCTVGTWTNGGVLRLIVTDDYNPDNNPSNTTWKASKVIDNIGPVTTGIARLQDKKNHKLWLYFGTGRYFHKQDDNAGQRRLFGIQELCYKETVTRSGGQTTKDDIDDKDTVCSGATLAFGDLENQTAGTSDSIGTNKGWYINLDQENTPTTGFGAERVITDPVAMTNGVVFYTTFKPTADICGFGGNSYMWAVKYSTGFQAPHSALKGKALIQVSTGSFEEVDLSTDFKDK